MNEKIIPTPIRIGLVSIAGQASNAEDEDSFISALREWFDRVIANPKEYLSRRVPGEQPQIESVLKELADVEKCCLILTAGGAGPAPSDVMPEATLAVADKVMPGIGELMREIGRNYLPTVMLSRQEAVIRGASLIINLPEEPRSIGETLDGAFPAVPYCIDLIGGPYIETHPGRVEAFRPKSATQAQLKEKTTSA